MIGLSVTPSVQWRDALGRFARFSLATPAQQRLTVLGQTSVSLLANATPVRTGAMRSGYRSTFIPSQQAVHITNLMPYARYVIFGTSRMRPNPALQAVLADLARQGHDAGQSILGDLAVALKS